MQTRHLTKLKDKRLTERGNLLLNRLFAIRGQSIRQLKTVKRRATLSVRFSQVELSHNQFTAKTVADTVSLYGIEACELTQSKLV